MTAPGPTPDVWSRLRALCVGPIRERRRYALPDGVESFPPSEVSCSLPATAEQLQDTEAALGFPLPAALRHLYLEVANGGLHVGPVGMFYGAIGGCPDAQGRTIERLASPEGWELHPSIAESMLRHPRTYVIVDSRPSGLLAIADAGCGISVELHVRTGRLYSLAYWNEIAKATPDGVLSHHLLALELVAPSLEDWFTRWLDEPWSVPPAARRLLPELVAMQDLPDPSMVWRGLYRFGPEWDRVTPEPAASANAAAPDSAPPDADGADR
jgi:hypothetical protein